MRLRVTSVVDVFCGTGDDEVGVFEFSGKPLTTPGQWEFTKSYVGKHSVRYRATQVGMGLVGRWFLGDLCGGSFILWPGDAPNPTGPMLAAVPKVELLTPAIRRSLVALDLGMLGLGLVGIVAGVHWSPSKMALTLCYASFGVYLALQGACHRWLMRRVIRRSMGPLGQTLQLSGGHARQQLRAPVTPVQLLASAALVAVLLYTLWVSWQKPWIRHHHNTDASHAAEQ
jgi:hypothetical protein